MSPAARLMCGIGLVLIPTIVYGGVTVLYIISKGKLGPGGAGNLTPDQVSFCPIPTLRGARSNI
jgi:hypothetical protein